MDQADATPIQLSNQRELEAGQAAVTLPSEALSSHGRLLGNSTLSRDIVMFATADWDCPFWTNKQHIASRLAELGYRVLYIESFGLRAPTLKSRDLSRIFRRLLKAASAPRSVSPGIHVWSPLLLPWHHRAWAQRFNRYNATRSLKSILRRLKLTNPIIWTYHPLIEHLLPAIDPSMIVYHCVDDLASAPGINAQVIQPAHEHLIQKADVVFATSRRLEQTCNEICPDKAVYSPNVADYQHFSDGQAAGPEPNELADIPRPRLGFVGAISPYKLDFDLISDVARRRPDWHWVLIGQVGEGQPHASIERLKHPNVHLLGPKAYEQIPSYLRGFDVATIPASKNDYTASMYPMKFFEYLAAGKKVVVSNVPALNEYRDVCCEAESADQFISIVENLLAGEGPDSKTCIQSAERHTWDRKLEQMLEHIHHIWNSSQTMKLH